MHTACNIYQHSCALSFLSAMLLFTDQGMTKINFYNGTDTNNPRMVDLEKYNQILTSNHAEDLVSSNDEKPPLLFYGC